MAARYHQIFLSSLGETPEIGEQGRFGGEFRWDGDRDVFAKDPSKRWQRGLPSNHARRTSEHPARMICGTFAGRPQLHSPYAKETPLGAWISQPIWRFQRRLARPGRVYGAIRSLSVLKAITEGCREVQLRVGLG